ncbi:hypothetical protein [Halorarum salinum]|uniref:Uncharacterized protein n=1 Tax=Halorarum salinum TaxID=2743089 RepID=A0A7D5LCZ6_9EURY|nr:hypothetical protein [Halobaculum salinum]QLG63055.1 hypothetical protein HUG12_15470 [Halobaculum salinum]
MPEHLRILGEDFEEIPDEALRAAAHAAYHELAERGVDVTGVAPVFDESVVVRQRGVEYTPLEEFAAELSGILALDATAVEGQSVAKIHASKSALEHNEHRLMKEGYNTELYLGGIEEDDPPTLLVHPRPGDLAEASDG